MAKDNRVIHGGIMIGEKLYEAGLEDELEEVMSPKQSAALSDAGVLEGDWEAWGKESPPMPGSRALRESGKATESAPPAAPESRKTVSRMNQAELRALATDEGIEIADNATNGDIRDALKAAGVE